MLHFVGFIYSYFDYDFDFKPILSSLYVLFMSLSISMVSLCPCLVISSILLFYIISYKFTFYFVTHENSSFQNPQAQPIDPDLTAKLLGRGVAVSPVVTVEPRRRKFHKAITLSIPTPRAHSQGMINQYSGNAPTLRLLCSITGMCWLWTALLRF